MAPKPTSKPRGEVAELTASLQSLCTHGKRSDKELRAQKREVFKKVVSYLSIGMDMSSLFPSMTSCANLTPDDVVLKKMLYLYITHYAAQTPDLALLTINQLHKDCIDQDPLVRGLALRSLCSLRISNYMEYVTSPVLAGLDDRHPYVRRAAVVGVLKIFHIDPAVVGSTGMLDRLKLILQRDADAQVLANCVQVLLKIEPVESFLTKALMYTLVNRMKDFSEWAQCLVLHLAASYKPGSDQEVYDLLNTLEERLGAGNSAVVLATTRAFLHLTLSMSATHQQVLERVKEPLKSLIGRDEPAITYAVLAHVLLLVQRAPIIFEPDYTAFYCRAHDPWYIKRLKMEILATLATSSNCYDIITELTEYTRDTVNQNMAREAVKAIGRIALAIPDVSGIIERLLVLLESNCEAVIAEALVQMKDLLRRYPDMAEVVVTQVMSAGVGSNSEQLAPSLLFEPEARAALIWILGQFGQHIPDAPYLLEPLADSYSSEEPAVRLALLTAAAQLFFKRPPEAQLLLGRLLAAGVADTHQDVHDRALLYYRLLRTNIAEAERIINPPLLAVAAFSETLTVDMRDAVFAEFNTLSVVYQAPASTFLDAAASYKPLQEEDAAEAGPAGSHDTSDPSAALMLDHGSDLLGGDGDGSAAWQPSPGLELDHGLAPATASHTSSVPAGPTHGSGLSLDPLSLLDSAHPFTPAPPGAASAQLPNAAPGGPGTAQRGGPMDLDSLLGGGQGLSFQPAPPSAQAGGAAGVRPAAAGAATNGKAGGGDLLDMLGFLPAAAAPALAYAPSRATFSMPGPASGAPQPAAPAVAAGNGFDDLFGGLPAARPTPPAPPARQLTLNAQAKMAANLFQESWRKLSVGHQYSVPVNPPTLAAMVAGGHKDFCAHMRQAYIMTMASGGQAPSYKYYFYAQDMSGALLLVEMVVSAATHSATVLLKSDDPSLLPQFKELWVTCLLGFGVGDGM